MPCAPGHASAIRTAPPERTTMTTATPATFTTEVGKDRNGTTRALSVALLGFDNRVLANVLAFVAAMAVMVAAAWLIERLVLGRLVRCQLDLARAHVIRHARAIPADARLDVDRHAEQRGLRLREKDDHARPSDGAGQVSGHDAVRRPEPRCAPAASWPSSPAFPSPPRTATPSSAWCPCSRRAP